MEKDENLAPRSLELFSERIQNNELNRTRYLTVLRREATLPDSDFFSESVNPTSSPIHFAYQLVCSGYNFLVSENTNLIKN